MTGASWSCQTSTLLKIQLADYWVRSQMVAEHPMLTIQAAASQISTPPASASARQKCHTHSMQLLSPFLRSWCPELFMHLIQNAFKVFPPTFCLINYLMGTIVVRSICFHCSPSSFGKPAQFLLHVYHGNIWITVWINSHGEFCWFVVKCFSRTGVETTGQCCYKRNYTSIFSKAQYFELPCAQTAKKSVGSLAVIFSLERAWWRVTQSPTQHGCAHLQ